MLKWVAVLYRELWSHTTGRPWTYVIRDFAYQNPLLWLLVGIWAGILLAGRFMSLEHWIFYSSGLLSGHLFWGTHYIPNQGIRGGK